MKRLAAAAVLLAAIILICIFSGVITNKAYEKFDSLAEKCSEAYSGESAEKAEQLAARLRREWHSDMVLLSAFINHGILDDIGCSAARLEGCAAKENASDFAEECEVLRLLLEYMKEDGLFSSHNLY